MVVDFVQGQLGKISIQFENDTFDITSSVINFVLNLPIKTPFDNHATDDKIRTMLREIGYIGSVASMSKLSRPFLRKEWSFFFDQLSKGFTGKCSAFEQITSLICQIGYILLFNRVIDIGSLLLNHIGLKLNCANRSKVYYHRFIMMLVNHFIPNSNERFGTKNVNATYSQHKRLFLDMKRTHEHQGRHNWSNGVPCQGSSSSFYF